MKLSVLSEGYGSAISFKYDNYKTDPKPRVLLLGRYKHPNTRNILVNGLNLKYLTPDEILQVRQVLPEILKSKNLKSRYWKGRQLLPDIFGKAWRSYDQDYIGAISRDTLKFYRPEELPPEPGEPTTPTPPTLPVAPAGVPKVPEVAPGIKVPMPIMKEKPPVIEPSVADLLAAPPKPEEEPKPEPEKIETGLEKPQLGTEPPEGSKETTPKVEPEMETPPTERGVGVTPKIPKLPKPQPKVPPDKKKGLTSAQRRQEKAKAMKKAIEVQRQTKPPVKPQPPDEIRGAMGLFKKKE
jgi:hypothetical protein